MVVIEELGEKDKHDESDDERRREKLETITVKFLRIARRLGQMPPCNCNVVVNQVLYRLGLQLDPLMRHNNQEYASNIIDAANLMAEQLEAAAAPLDFSCTILVLGKTGTGKSATINSIFDDTEEEIKLATNAFERCTREVQRVVGTVEGIKLRVIDTPGLVPCWSDEQHNQRILTSVKHSIEKTPPDVVIYVDRLDLRPSTSTNDDDGPLLRDITDALGASVWHKAIVVLTHAASSPSDAPSNSGYDMLVARKSHAVQLAVAEAAGDMRLRVPVSLVENNQHSSDSTVWAAASILLEKRMWRPHLLLLSFASKILVEAASAPAPPRSNKPFRLGIYPRKLHYLCLCDPVNHGLYRAFRGCGCCSGVESNDDDGSPSWKMNAVKMEETTFDREDDGGKVGISYVANRRVRGLIRYLAHKGKACAFLKLESVCKINHGGAVGEERETYLFFDADRRKGTWKKGLLYKGLRWKDALSCKLMTDTRVINHGRYKANAGLLCSADGNNAVVGGVAVRNEITAANEKFSLMVSGCAMTMTPHDAAAGIAYGGYLKAVYEWSSSVLVQLHWLLMEPGGAAAGARRNLSDSVAISSMFPAGRDSVVRFIAGMNRGKINFICRRSLLTLLFWIPSFARVLKLGTLGRMVKGMLTL